MHTPPALLHHALHIGSFVICGMANRQINAMGVFPLQPIVSMVRGGIVFIYTQEVADSVSYAAGS